LGPEGPGRRVLSPPRPGRDGSPGRRHQERRVRLRHPWRGDDRPVRHRGPEGQGRSAEEGRRPGRRGGPPSPAGAGDQGPGVRGVITDDERYEQVVDVWQKTTTALSDEMMKGLKADGPVTMMTASGARGNKGNIGQLGAMRGLMADPSGRIIDVPVRSNFREGMTVLEYFISTHGARKGLAATALRTADSGYLTRRRVDVAQDVITRDDDCGTEEGSWITREDSSDEREFRRRLVGRLAAAPLPDPTVKVKKGETAPIIVDRNEEITEETAGRI